MKFRILRDQGREIGLDVLVYSFAGMRFAPPGEKFIRAEEVIFEADLKTCRVVAGKLGDCHVADANGKRVGS